MKILRILLENTNQVIKRLEKLANSLQKMDLNMLGSIHVLLINLQARNSLKPLIPCLNGIRDRVYVMSI
jgi:hypothetical protein